MIELHKIAQNWNMCIPESFWLRHLMKLIGIQLIISLPKI